MPNFEIQQLSMFRSSRFNPAYIIINLIAMALFLLYALLFNKSGHTGMDVFSLASLNFLVGLALFVMNSFQKKRISFDNWLLLALPILLLVLIGLFSSLNILVHYDNQFQA